jgi:hypothetical protein
MFILLLTVTQITKYNLSMMSETNRKIYATMSFCSVRSAFQSDIQLTEGT